MHIMLGRDIQRIVYDHHQMAQHLDLLIVLMHDHVHQLMMINTEQRQIHQLMLPVHHTRVQQYLSIFRYLSKR